MTFIDNLNPNIKRVITVKEVMVKGKKSYRGVGRDKGLYVGFTTAKIIETNEITGELEFGGPRWKLAKKGATAATDDGKKQ